MSLTIKGIETAKSRFNEATGKHKETKLADGNGLFLVVSEHSKRWVARYLYKGREQTLALGKFPIVGLKEARDKNFLLRKELDKGINPADQRREDKEQTRMALMERKAAAKGLPHPLSFEVVALDWLHDVKKRWRATSYEGTKRRINLHLISTIGAKHINEITPADMRAVFAKLDDESKCDTLRKIAECSIRIFNFAIAIGKCENNPAYAIWRGLSYKKPSKERGFPTITDPDAVGRLLLALEALPMSRRGIEGLTAIRIAPYVFLRPASLVWGEWEEVDWEAREWRLPPHKMKNGKPHVVPLARQVCELLRELHKYTGASGFMFPSWGNEGHLSAMSLLRSVRDAGYGPGVFSPHGFRHMAVTLLKELEFPHDVIYLQLSHTLERSAAKAAYDKAQLLPQRAAMMQAYADFLDTLREKARKENEE